MDLGTKYYWFICFGKGGFWSVFLVILNLEWFSLILLWLVNFFSLLQLQYYVLRNLMKLCAHSHTAKLFLSSFLQHTTWAYTIKHFGTCSKALLVSQCVKMENLLTLKKYFIKLGNYYLVRTKTIKTLHLRNFYQGGGGLIPVIFKLCVCYMSRTSTYILRTHTQQSRGLFFSCRWIHQYCHERCWVW